MADKQVDRKSFKRRLSIKKKVEKKSQITEDFGRLNNSNKSTYQPELNAGGKVKVSGTISNEINGKSKNTSNTGNLDAKDGMINIEEPKIERFKFIENMDLSNTISSVEISPTKNSINITNSMLYVNENKQKLIIQRSSKDRLDDTNLSYNNILIDLQNYDYDNANGNGHRFNNNCVISLTKNDKYKTHSKDNNKLKSMENTKKNNENRENKDIGEMPKNSFELKGNGNDHSAKPSYQTPKEKEIKESNTNAENNNEKTEKNIDKPIKSKSIDLKYASLDSNDSAGRAKSSSKSYTKRAVNKITRSRSKLQRKRKRDKITPRLKYLELYDNMIGTHNLHLVKRDIIKSSTPAYFGSNERYPKRNRVQSMNFWKNEKPIYMNTGNGIEVVGLQMMEEVETPVLKKFKKTAQPKMEKKSEILATKTNKQETEVI